MKINLVFIELLLSHLGMCLLFDYGNTQSTNWNEEVPTGITIKRIKNVPNYLPIKKVD